MSFKATTLQRQPLESEAQGQTTGGDWCATGVSLPEKKGYCWKHIRFSQALSATPE